MEDVNHALEPSPGADSRVFAYPRRVEARGTVAGGQDGLIGALEQAVGHFVPEQTVSLKSGVGLSSYKYIANGVVMRECL